MQNFQVLGALPPDLVPPVGGGFTLGFQRLGALPPHPQTQSPIANFWLRAWQLFTVCKYVLFCSFCFGQFFLDRSVATV